MKSKPKYRIKKVHHWFEISRKSWIGIWFLKYSFDTITGAKEAVKILSDKDNNPYIYFDSKGNEIV